MEEEGSSLLDEAFATPEDNWSMEVPQDELEENLSIDTSNLIYIGHLTDQVTVAGHVISIRTLRIGEELEAALLADRYKDTVEASRALATAMVAAAITAVDGQSLVEQGLGPGDNTLEGRFRFILRNWYWVTIRDIYTAYNALLSKVFKSYDELKKD